MLSHAERGRLGGQRTFQLYGTEHMVRNGRAGFAALREKYFAGCDAATARFLLSINASKFGTKIKDELKCACAACGRIGEHAPALDLSDDYIRQLEREGW